MDEYNHIGEQLKQARIKKGYTLDDLQQLTKIQKRYLIAIEEHNLNELPGDFFVKAFIRQYADVVDVSIDDEAIPELEELSISDEERLPSRADIKRSSKETDFKYGSGSQNKLPTILVVLLVVFIIGLIWFYFFFIRENDSTESEVGMINQSQIITTLEEEAVSESVSSESPSEEDTQEAVSRVETGDDEVLYTVKNVSMPGTLTLETDLSGASWMLVEVNGTEEFQGTLQPGMTQEVMLPEGTETVAIRIGYLPATTIVFGENGEVTKPDNSNDNQTQTLMFEIEE